MADSKKIVIFITHTPFCGDFCEEGLRLALGTGNSMISHDVTLVFAGDGVWFALKSLQQRDFEKYIKALSALDGTMIIEKESLDDRKIAEDMIKPEIQIMSRAAIFEILKESDFSISY